ncbi:MAG: glycosyltransferase [Alphaproteobacteria bacterium]|nr:glycosyltransferase [Alphaproteobacteria bacterium]
MRSAFGTTAIAKRGLLNIRKQALRQFMEKGEKLEFPTAVAPRATLVITAHNHAYHTLACLQSLQPFVDSSIEVLVQDDASTSETSALLARCVNVTVRRNQENRGFLHSANAAAAAARGKFIIFMNNDARMLGGSLAEALDLFEALPGCGLMGGRVVQANGGLQEAGCVIFNDGTTNGYLRYEAEDDPRALFLRDVDYCSGVFLITRNDVFLKLGGFDPCFAPAYYEETDYCMRLRQAGLRCIYNPNLRIEHFEFGSSTSRRARASISANRMRFFERWQAVMAAEGYPAPAKGAAMAPAALRLQQRPRRLLVASARNFDAKAAMALADSGGSLTVFLMGASRDQTRQAIAATGMRVEMISGASRRAAEALMAARKGWFDEILPET